MLNLGKSFVKAISTFSPEILKKPELMIRVLEDLSPTLTEEIHELRQVYSKEIGSLVYDTFIIHMYNMMEFESQLDKMGSMKVSSRKRFLHLMHIIFINDNIWMNEGEKKDNPFDAKGEIDSKRELLVRLLYKLSVLKSYLEQGIAAEMAGDTIKAIGIYQKLNDGSCYEKSARMRLAKIFESSPERSFKNYLRAANLGDPEGAFHVGYMFEYGEGTEKDLRQAIKYYIKAVKSGHRGAAHNLGYFYYSGNGVQKDLKLAYELFDYAASKGKADSMRNLGVMYENGEYVKKDFEKALFWYTQAYDHGASEAKKDCLRIHQKRLGF